MKKQKIMKIIFSERRKKKLFGTQIEKNRKIYKTKSGNFPETGARKRDLRSGTRGIPTEGLTSDTVIPAAGPNRTGTRTGTGTGTGPDSRTTGLPVQIAGLPGYRPG